MFGAGVRLSSKTFKKYWQDNNDKQSPDEKESSTVSATDTTSPSDSNNGTSADGASASSSSQSNSSHQQQKNGDLKSRLIGVQETLKQAIAQLERITELEKESTNLKQTISILKQKYTESETLLYLHGLTLYDNETWAYNLQKGFRRGAISLLRHHILEACLESFNEGKEDSTNELKHLIKDLLTNFEDDKTMLIVKKHQDLPKTISQKIEEYDTMLVKADNLPEQEELEEEYQPIEKRIEYLKNLIDDFIKKEPSPFIKEIKSELESQINEYKEKGKETLSSRK